MSATADIASDSVTSAVTQVAKELLGSCKPQSFAIRLWDGGTIAPEATGAPRFTLIIRHPGAVRNLLTASDLQLGEAYIYDGVDIEGDVEACFELADALLRRDWYLAERLHLARLIAHLPTWDVPRRHSQKHPPLPGRLHSVERDRHAITRHYDISNDFYRLWLDEQMVYSCAYFERADNDLEAAQMRKLDYICRKLRLRPGERLLDLGCGWGALIIHAARNYGVTAVGITVSRAQAELANERIREAGVADHCLVELRDYREVSEWGEYDKLVSVGMFEHVGEQMLPEYFETAFRLLRVGGVFLNHGISRAATQPPRKNPTFISTYVFPDSDLVPISTTLHAAERAGFEVRDLESLREHYALTLREWGRRLESHEAEARRITGDVTYRIFRLYMAGSAHWFATGRNNVYQALLVKSDRGNSMLPLTRTDWY